MRLIVTRPLAQATPAVEELIALGVPAVALPLIGIEAVTDAECRVALQRAWATLPGRKLVMFVSANAVAHFFAAAIAGAGIAWPAHTLAGSTGPGTTAALVAAGVPPTCVVSPGPEATRLDSEALWQRLRDKGWRGANVLIVRGGSGRDWLADTLREAGARVEFVCAYRRQLPQLQPKEEALLASAQIEPAAHLWQFSSSEAAHNLRQLAPQAHWGTASAFASHERIGEAARAIGFGRVRVLAPGPAALLQGWREHVRSLGNDPGSGLGTSLGTKAASIQCRPL